MSRFPYIRDFPGSRSLHLTEPSMGGNRHVMLQVRGQFDSQTVPLTYEAIEELQAALQLAKSTLLPRNAGAVIPATQATAPVLTEAQRLQIDEVVRQVEALRAMLEDPSDGA